MSWSRTGALVTLLALVATGCQFVPAAFVGQSILFETCQGQVGTHGFGFEPSLDPPGGSTHFASNGDDIIVIANGPVTVDAGAGDDLICVTDGLASGPGAEIEIIGGAGNDTVIASPDVVEHCVAETHDCDSSTLPDEGPPNVVYIMVDDLGLGDLPAFYPPSPLSTPNLDALAARGTMLTHFRSAAPVCSPTRAAVLTGRDPAAVGVRTIVDATSSTHLDPSEETLAEMFNGVGYDTHHVGKWHLMSGRSRVDEADPVGAGFQTSVRSNRFYRDPTIYIDRGLPVTNGQPNQREPRRIEQHPGGHTTEVYTDEAIDLIQQSAGASTPFFLNLWYDAPHRESSGSWSLPDSSPLYGDPTLTDAERYIELVRVLDEQIGRLMVALNDAGVARNTLVVFTSDNGGLQPLPVNFLPWSTAGLRGKKNMHWEGGLRVPLIAHWPGAIDAGSSSNDPGTSEDIFATFAELVGHDATHTHGDSLLPTLQGLPNPAVTDRVVFYEGSDMARTIDIDDQNPYDHAVIEDGRWKLVSVAFGTEERGFFDLLTDPTESNNLIDDPAHTAHIDDLQSQYDAWSHQTSLAALTTGGTPLATSWSGTFDGTTHLTLDANPTIDFGSRDFTFSVDVTAAAAALTNPSGVTLAERPGSWSLELTHTGLVELVFQTTDGQTTTLVSTAPLQADVPTRVSFTVKDWVQGSDRASRGRLYIDSVRHDLEVLAPAGDWVVESDEPVHVGGAPSTPGLVGDLDDLEIHNRTLTATQLAAIS